MQPFLYSLLFPIVFTNVFASGQLPLVQPAGIQIAPTAEAAAVAYLQPSKIPAWWPMGEEVKFHLTAGRIPETLISIKAVITDVSGRHVAADHFTRADVEANGWTWAPPSPGFYMVEFSQVDAGARESPLGGAFTMRAPNGVTRDFKHTQMGFAVLPPISPIKEPVGQFGYTHTLKLENIPLAKLVGFDLANIHPIPWGANFVNIDMAIEREKGVYRWEILDPHIDALVNANFIIAGQFCYTPLWASPHPEKTNINICVVEGTAYAPNDIEDYSRFVEATVRRYGNHIQMWELWNEPAVPGGSVFWSDTPENFVRLMEAGYRTIKRVQPGSEIWFGGIGGRAAYYAFYERALKLGAAAFFDVLSLHGNASLDDFRLIEQKLGTAPKPAVMSEWHAILQGNSQSAPVMTEDALSFRMMRNLLLQLQQGLTRTMFFEMGNLVEKEVLPFARENQWFVHSSGLFRRQPYQEPRHAAVVMANFLERTGKKAVFRRMFHVGPEVSAMEISTGRGSLAVFWSEAVAVQIRAIARYATPDSQLTDWEGKPIGLEENGQLEPNRLFYLTAPNAEKIGDTPVPTATAESPARLRDVLQPAEGFHYDGPLFTAIDSAPSVPAEAWITNGWKSTNVIPADTDRKFSARAAVGAHEQGLDLVLEIDDSTLVPSEDLPNLAQGDSIQFAIDSEGNGQIGGQTEFIASLSANGAILWKSAAADTRGDIPGQWTPAQSTVKHATVRVVRDGDIIRYQARIAWAEMYPITYEESRPLRISFVVNNDNGSGRIAYLEWGSGLATSKDPNAYGRLLALEPRQFEEEGAKSERR